MTYPGSRTECTCEPETVAPRASRSPTVWAIGHRGLRVLHVRQAGGELTRGAARRIDLVVVRVVDDFPVGNESRGELRALQEQHRRQREVPRRQDSTPGFLRGDVNRLEIGGGQSRGANNDVRAFREGRENVALGTVWLRVFDEHVAGMYESFLSRRIDRTRQARLPKHITEDTPCMLTRDRGHDREIWLARNGPRQLRPSPTCRSREADGESHTVQYGGGVWFAQTRAGDRRVFPRHVSMSEAW